MKNMLNPPPPPFPIPPPIRLKTTSNKTSQSGENKICMYRRKSLPKNTVNDRKRILHEVFSITPLYQFETPV